MLTTSRRLERMNRSLASAAAATAAFRATLRLPLASSLGGFAACLDHPRELPLVLGGEQRDLADVVQVQTDRVVHDDGVSTVRGGFEIRIRYCAG